MVATDTATQNASLLLDIQDVSFANDDRQIVFDVSLELTEGEIGSIVGPSGCGKSTLMRGIAGFETPSHGSITMLGRTLSTPDTVVEPEHRGVGMVFQDVTLFPHLSVTQNIEFGIRKWPLESRKARVTELLNLLGLVGFDQRHPHSLSGGEQQRIALARAMAPKPHLLLLDEAFSSLDLEHRQTLVPEVREVLKAENISAILVTHDHNEAFAMADRIGVMENGRLHQWDTPFNIYHKPYDQFTARFIGEGAMISATVVGEQQLQSAFGTHSIRQREKLEIGEQVDIMLRPDDILHDDESTLKGEVIQKSFRGSHFLYRIRLASQEVLYCLADSHHNHHIGEWIGINPNIEHIVIFNKHNDQKHT